MSAYLDTDWTLISFERPKKAAVEQSAAVPFPAPLPVKGPCMCPRCGRALKARGQHLHIRACKGKSE